MDDSTGSRLPRAGTGWQDLPIIPILGWELVANWDVLAVKLYLVARASKQTLSLATELIRHPCKSVVRVDGLT